MFYLRTKISVFYIEDPNANRIAMIRMLVGLLPTGHQPTGHQPTIGTLLASVKLQAFLRIFFSFPVVPGLWSFWPYKVCSAFQERQLLYNPLCTQYTYTMHICIHIVSHSMVTLQIIHFTELSTIYKILYIKI